MTQVAVARRWPNRIRILRQERGLLIRELAALAGINRSQLSRYELGVIVPDWTNATAIATALGVSIADLGIAEQVASRATS